jgi:hypothetical protein
MESAAIRPRSGTDCRKHSAARYHSNSGKKWKNALEILKNLIPPGAEVMNGSSTTLLEIGYDEYVNSGKSRWKDLHRSVIAENDEKERRALHGRSRL